MNRGLNRRHLLCCGATAAMGLFTVLAPQPAQAMWRNPCLEPLGRAGMLGQDTWAQALHGLDAAALWDNHAHLLGTGDSGSGCHIHPDMQQGWHPVERLRMLVIMNAACVERGAASIDQAYVQRLVNLTHDFPSGARWLLYAFDHALDDAGAERPEHTTFHVPNAYAASVANQHAQRFAWVASIHPYRLDALARLDAALAQGALAIKWLPSAMNIDLRDARLAPFYARLAATRTPLIVHCGEERAAPGARRDDLGNPLLVRAALSVGVRVIVAHCASLGHALDLDARSAPRRAAFDLFARLMDEPAWHDLLLGDISGVFQFNREPAVWRAVLQRQDWHARLLHGSDYPLPGVPLLHQLGRLVQAGLLHEDQRAGVEALRGHNPLAFDLAVKRSLRLGNLRLRDEVFDTRRHFRSTTGRV